MASNDKSETAYRLEMIVDPLGERILLRRVMLI